MKFFLESVFYSYAQIFFSNRYWVGIAIFISTLVSPKIGLMGLCGVVISNLIATVLKFDNEKIRTGFYGFNGILFGAATAYYFEITLPILIIIGIFFVITFFLSAVLENYLAVAFNLPGLSLPFILSLYIFLIFLTNQTNVHSAVEINSLSINLSFIPEYLNNYLSSFSFILFQPNILSGLIIITVLLFFSRVIFVLSIVAFVINSLLLQYLIPNHYNELIIITGFNSILTSIALGGSLIILSKRSLILVSISIVMVIILTGFFTTIVSIYNLPILVLPFNFVVLFVLYSLKFRKDQTDFALLYFQPGSPEENYYYHNTRKARFDKFKYLFPELPVFGEWFISQGHNGDYTHKNQWKYAWDFVVTDNNKLQSPEDPQKLEDYYCYKLPVIAPLDGTIVKVIDGIPNNKIGEVNIENNWGNTVIIEHESGLFSAISHFEPNSIKVTEGKKVKKGEALGLCGNSGRSPYPHIHFQFQATDKLGDKTFNFPFAHFILKNENEHELKTFSIPEEDSLVQNIEIHKTIQKAFDFKYGESYSFQYDKNNKTITEEWNVDIDIMNTMFIINSFGDKLRIYKTEKIFFITDYIGKKDSALYYFYISASQVPLTFINNLRWFDTFPVSAILNNGVRYLSEFLLFFNQMINVKSGYSIKQNDKDFNIISEIKIKGEGLFSFYNDSLSNKVVIDNDGIIKEIISQNKNKYFIAKALLKEEEI